MRKTIILAAMALISSTSFAQTTVNGSAFTDNWSFTLKGGGVAPAHHYSVIPNTRGIVGAELRKQVTPILGFGIEGEWTVNTSSWAGLNSSNVFDHQYVGAFTAVNIMNLFGGYKGAPRLFEIEAVGGAGWIHSFYPHKAALDANTWGTKAGLNLNFNVGKDKAWTFSLRPALLWNMGAGGNYSYFGHNAQYDLNCAFLEMQAAVTYHFGNMDGSHHFTLFRPYDPSVFDQLNAEVNALRGQVEATRANGESLEARIASLQANLDDCLSRPAVVKEVCRNLANVHYVFFANASSYIQPNQRPTVAMVAEALKADPNARLEIKGYASPVGSKAFNERLAQRRAQAVKAELEKKYGIEASRITAQGMGVGDIFSESSWNRVSVCTVE